MSERSMSRLPGIASACGTDRIPVSGKAGSPVSRRTGGPTILPALTRDRRSSSTYRIVPSGDHAHGHVPSQIGRGAPPAIENATVAADLEPPTIGAIATSQRRAGGAFI